MNGSMTYNAVGEMTGNTIGNGVAQAYSYNNRLQLTGITASLAGTSLMNVGYDYGSSATNTGRVLSRTDNVQQEHSAKYAYDSIYRLGQVISNDASWGAAWTFDVWGNRLTQTPQGLATSKIGTQTLGYTNNRINGNTYDAAGNQTNDGLHNYTFNAENQITQMDGGTAVYGYDGEGRRMKKTVGSETTFYFYSGSNLLCEFTTTNTGATQATSTDRTTYRTSDKLGSAVLVINASGVVIENNRTLPYGELWLPATASVNDQKFTSYLRDSESGLDYAMNRYMANSYGRFVTPDPKGIGAVNLQAPTSWNMYLYINDDPLNSIDPEGLAPCSEVVLEGWDGIPNGTTVGALLAQNSDLSAFAKTVFTEASVGWGDNNALEKGAIASVIMNRWQVVNGYQELYTPTGDRITGQGWGTANGTLRAIVWAGAGTSGAQFAVWASPGVLANGPQSQLNSALRSNETSNGCLSLLQSIGTVAGFWSDRSRRGLWVDSTYGLAFTSFGLSAANRSWYEYIIGNYGSPNIFNGVSPFNPRSRQQAAAEQGHTRGWVNLTGKPGGEVFVIQ